MAKGFASSKDSPHQQDPPQALPAALKAESVQQQWESQFAELEDPRGRQGVEHPFLSIVMIAILAVIGGATGWEDIETYAESHAVRSSGSPLSRPQPSANRDTAVATPKRVQVRFESIVATSWAVMTANGEVSFPAGGLPTSPNL